MAGLVSRCVVQRADQHQEHVRHDLDFRQHAGSAVRTEPPEHRLSGIAGVLIRLQLAFDGNRARRIRRDSLEASFRYSAGSSGNGRCPRTPDRRSACNGRGRTGSRQLHSPCHKPPLFLAPPAMPNTADDSKFIILRRSVPPVPRPPGTRRARALPAPAARAGCPPPCKPPAEPAPPPCRVHKARAPTR